MVGAFAQRQVVTVSPDGEIVTLDRRGRGLDLRCLGRVTVERASVVEFDEESQHWFVRFLVAPFRDRRLGPGLWRELGKEVPGPEPALFATYAEAVAAEIDFLEEARLHNLLG